MILSQQGYPSLDFTLDKTYFKQGDTIGNFTIPFNVLGDTQSIFYRFKLWNNSRGVCADGVNHKPFSGGKYRWLNESAVYCGDYILGKQVKTVISSFNHQIQLYEIHVIEYGAPKYATPSETDNDMIDSLCNSIDKLGELVNGFFSDYLTKVVATMQSTSPGSPIVTGPLTVANLEILKANFDGELDKIKQEMEQKKWH